MRKQGIKIYGIIKRLNPTRLTKQMIEFYKKYHKANNDTIQWSAAIKENFKVAGITQTNIEDGKLFRK